MDYESIDFNNITRIEFFKIRDFIREKLAEPHLGSLWKTAYHQIYNRLKGKENCHVLTKSHHDVYYFNCCLARAIEAVQECISPTKAEKETGSISNA